MVVKVFHKTRGDGVKLFKRFDAAVDANGNPIKAKNGDFVPSGFKIKKVGTDETYAKAIDVEGAPYEYAETKIPIEESR